MFLWFIRILAQIKMTRLLRNNLYYFKNKKIKQKTEKFKVKNNKSLNNCK